MWSSLKSSVCKQFEMKKKNVICFNVKESILAGTTIDSSIIIFISKRFCLIICLLKIEYNETN